MSDEPNPIKDILYDVIGTVGEDWIKQRVLDGDTAGAISRLVADSITRVSELEGEPEVNSSKLLNSMLHYMLTLVMIPSQRKFDEGGTEVDIAIPDMKTVRSSPRDALLICIPALHGDKEEHARTVSGMHPEKGNVWYVGEGGRDRTYAVSDGSVNRIIDDINAFFKERKAPRFRFVGSN